MNRKVLRIASSFMAVLLIQISLYGCNNDSSKKEIKKMTLTIGQGETFESALTAALDKTGSTRTEILLPVGMHTINSALTIPENIVITIPKGSSFDIAKDNVMTINGEINAPPEYIFRGEGQVEGSISGKAYVQWFGADLVGSGDHTAVFQKALDTCKTILVPDRKSGYSITSLRFSKPVSLTGTGSVRVRINVSESPDLTYFDISSSNVLIENFTLYCPTSSNNELAVYFNTEKNDLENITLANVFINNPGFGIGDTNSKNHTAKNIELHNINIESNRNTGVHFTDLTTGIVLKDVVVSSFGGEVPGNQSKGYIFENIEEMYLENVDVLGGFPKSGTAGDGMTFMNCINVSSYRIMIDYVNGKQLVIKDCSGFKMSNFVVSLLKVEGMDFDNLQDSVLDVFKVNGVYPTDVPAFRMRNCHNVEFNVLIVQIAGQDGLIMENCTNNTINNLIISDCQGSALIEKGSSNNNIVNGLRTKNNGGGISLTGENSIVYGYIGNSRNVAASVTGGYSD